jgi:hypothetical protein
MTYSESAEGVTITKARALREIEAHGLVRGSDDWQAFFADLGDHETYSASAVLGWLGY